jgi:hypothetical protein
MTVNIDIMILIQKCIIFTPDSSTIFSYLAKFIRDSNSFPLYIVLKALTAIMLLACSFLSPTFYHAASSFHIFFIFFWFYMHSIISLTMWFAKLIIFSISSSDYLPVWTIDVFHLKQSLNSVFILVHLVINNDFSICCQNSFLFSNSMRNKFIIVSYLIF